MAETIGKHVGIRYDLGEARSIFANHFAVQATTHGEALLSFFEIVPPLILGDAEERKRKLDQIENVDAHCVARIVVTKERIPELVKAFTEIFGNLEQVGSEEQQGVVDVAGKT